MIFRCGARPSVSTGRRDADGAVELTCVVRSDMFHFVVFRKLDVRVPLRARMQHAPVDAEVLVSSFFRCSERVNVRDRKSVV